MLRKAGRRRFPSHAGLACLSHPVPQHRRHRSYLRCHHGHPLRPCGLPLDCARLHLCRSRPRLSLRHDLCPHGRHLSARDNRQRAGICHAARDAHRRPGAAGARRCCLRDDACFPARQHDGRPRLVLLEQLLADRHLPLLHPCHIAPHRQAHRQNIPHLRTRLAAHGRRHLLGYLHARRLDARADRCSLHVAPPERPPHLPHALHHHSLRRD